MNNLSQSHRIYLVNNVCVNIVRKLRGQVRKTNLTPPEASALPTAEKAPPPTYNVDHPLNKPALGQMMGTPAVAGLTEKQLKELAQLQGPVYVTEAEPEPEQPELVTVENQYEIIEKCITPIKHLRYTAQLEHKELHAFKLMRSLKERLLQVTPKLPAGQARLPCPLQPMIPSPVTEQYRSKDEFVVNKGVDGNPKTVGFLTGHPKLDTTVCVPPTSICIIRDSHKTFCSHFQRHIRSSRHDASIHFSDSAGVWRGAVVRSTTGGAVMASVTIHPHTLDQEEISEIEEDLRQYFFAGPGSEVGLTSLYLQICPHVRCSRQVAPYRLLQGSPYITETCSGLQFRLSPDTFFQVNTQAAEKLHDCIYKVADLSPLSTVLEVCSGNGALSLMMAQKLRGVVGVEAVSSFVDEANVNAEINGINNTTFVPGPPEKVLPLLTKDFASCRELVAVVNAGRGGLHPQVLHSLRSNRAITRLVLFSCKMDGYALGNIVTLANMMKGTKLRFYAPLLPRYAFTVDTSPHTEHYEMGFLLERETRN